MIVTVALTVLALAANGDMSRTESILFMSFYTRLQRQERTATVSDSLSDSFTWIFASVNEPLVIVRVTRSLKKKHPIFGNVAKTVAKLQKFKLKIKNSCIKLLLNVKISTKNCVLKVLILVKF